jgi:hypothetical protein
MNLTHDGLSLWYGTPDAPAPGDEGVVPRRGASLIVAARPANPSNTLTVRYRVDGGIAQTVTGRELRTDYAKDAQYFAVAFPPFVTGNTVEYSPILTCGGRQVPPPHIAERFPSKFHLAAREAPATRVAKPLEPTRAPLQRYNPGLGFVASVDVQFATPVYVGDTPGGMRVNFFVKEGAVKGEGFGGKVMEGSSDHLIVRRDGMGVVRIRAAFELEDGARLDVESGGYVDFGPDGYKRALAHDLPPYSPLVVNPLISTRHPKYRWLGKIQCIGVGHTHLDVNQACYRVFAVQPRSLT